MTILIKRIPGDGKQKPAFRILKDGLPVHEETIAGRADVQPAFLRVVAFSEKNFQLKAFFPAGRDQQKHLTWTSERPAPKPVKEAKVSTAILHAGIKAAQSPAAVIHRATPKS